MKAEYDFSGAERGKFYRPRSCDRCGPDPDDCPLVLCARCALSPLWFTHWDRTRGPLRACDYPLWGITVIFAPDERAHARLLDLLVEMLWGKLCTR